MLRRNHPTVRRLVAAVMTVPLVVGFTGGAAAVPTVVELWAVHPVHEAQVLATTSLVGGSVALVGDVALHGAVAPGEAVTGTVG